MMEPECALFVKAQAAVRNPIPHPQPWNVDEDGNSPLCKLRRQRQMLYSAAAQENMTNKLPLSTY